MITVLLELPRFKWQNFRCEHLGQATMTTTHGIRLVFLISETSILIMTRTGWLGSTPPSRTLTWPVVFRATESSRWRSSQKFYAEADWGLSEAFPFHSRLTLIQGPAVGRGIAELLLDGAFSSLDLTALSFDRCYLHRQIKIRKSERQTNKCAKNCLHYNFAF